MRAYVYITKSLGERCDSVRRPGTCEVAALAVHGISKMTRGHRASSHRAEVTRSYGVGPGILDSEWAEGCPAMAACLGQVRTPHLSVVWRVGSTLPEIPQLPPRAGVPPLGRARSAQPIPSVLSGPAGV